MAEAGAACVAGLRTVVLDALGDEGRSDGGHGEGVCDAGCVRRIIRRSSGAGGAGRVYYGGPCDEGWRAAAGLGRRWQRRGRG
eukprot:1595551-Pleurochrysis_carterae.AAC.1